jgi:membrane protease YdiL (CAAX protease family)
MALTCTCTAVVQWHKHGFSGNCHLRRGFALQTLMKVWPDRPAFNILVTGAVFGALHTHYPVWGQVACAVRGLALGTVYLWLDRNLLVPITAHALANLVAILSRLNAA